MKNKEETIFSLLEEKDLLIRDFKKAEWEKNFELKFAIAAKINELNEKVEKLM